MINWSEEEFKKYVKTNSSSNKKRKSKYRAEKMELDGILFDSKKEAERYSELKMLERANLITNLELQPKFLLQEKFEYNGKVIRKIEYIADFKYIDEKGNTVVEDVKGLKTDVYNIKKKLFLNKYMNEKLIFKEI
ncbi:MAG: hypothetical protein PEPC_00102 [Peptostreptococcus russellii]|uniref:DUF1064 domain-containing protein n=1 Tax=Peptostreptococcus russellii TaxID=215200 RepID=UPI003046A4FE